jgi:uncharacterized membrane protein YkvA (DUF1232 family)
MTGTQVVLHEPKGLVAVERLLRRRFWPRLLAVLAALPFAEEALAGCFCVMDGRTPRAAKLMPLLALAGMVLPARLIPLPLRRLGLSADAAMLMGALQALGGHITSEHRARARLLLIRLRRGRSVSSAPVP